ncbi:hypothetical protein SASPL_123214 [Salvia splendens]|uniref:Reverse transcriptase Ty1/copia-type domain-containing protein n=1 Tax=Salvia splendens TaxID=180675 RepID=A0A8X8ZT73_SALSN|nr:hypothetical protein SASPL_123214 [Salvia splendens]
MAAQTPDPLLVNTMINITPVKLDSTTYLIWHRQMLHMAECFDLQGFLDGSVVAPPSSLTSDVGVSSPNPVYNSWRMKDRKLLSVIWTSVSAEAMSEVIECSSSHSAWSTLQVAFSDSSVSRTHQLRDELLSLRRGAQSVEEYGRKFKGLCDQLSAINRPVDDSDKGHWFLRGLRSQYTSFADTRLALTLMPMFRDLLHQAKQFESMLRAMDVLPTSPAAFSAERGRGNSNPHLNNGNSSQTSHSGGRSGRLPYTPRCQICRGDHYADKCPQFLNAHNAIPSAHLAEAFKASCSVAPPASDWYLDSGTPTHMTNQQYVIDSCAPYSGNGSIIAADKLSPQSRPCIFLGYSSMYKGFRCLDPTSHQIFITRHAQFDETLFPFSSESSSSSPSNMDIVSFMDEASLLSTSASPTPSVPTPSTLRPPPQHPSALFDDEEPDVPHQPEMSAHPKHQPELPAHPEHQLELQPEQPAPPATEPAAQVAPHVQHPMVTRARASMQEEIDSLHAYGTWDLVPHPLNMNIVGSKWVFRTKYCADGSIERYKARLVAQGFTQILGSDFHHTFSLVVKAATVRVSRADSSLFHFHRGPSTIFLLLYVDDIIVTGNDQSLLQRFISQIHKEFAIKDLGRLNYFLGLEVSYTHDGLFIGQAKYAHDIIKRVELLDSKPVATPLSAGEVLVREGSPFRDPSLYRSLVGVLQYLTITRPDLSYAINLVSQFLQSPTDDHFQALKRIIWYVKGTIHFGLSFTRRTDSSVIGYSDADWARCIDTRRSTYGYSIFLGRNIVSWSAKKQPTVARSSCESEYRAMANTAVEIIWLSNLLHELQSSPSSRPQLLCDNKSAIFLSQNPVTHK